jgi:aminopeptidase YwaD
MTQHHDPLTHKAREHLDRLCRIIDNRRVGSDGNRDATAYAAGQLAACGFHVETTAFDCMDWRTGGVTLAAGDVDFTAFSSPYATGCDVRAPLRVIGTADELSAADDLHGAVVLLRGAIAREQIMPKNFPFWNPDEHRQIVERLERVQPAALITASGRSAEVAGALYPFPMFEDGDFDLPSVFMTDREGDRLAALAGQLVTLESRAERVPATGVNVVAHRGRRDRRITCFGHIDAKIGTPGALDNASGAVVMLLLAELLADHDGALGVEIVPVNGEDYYANPGEQVWLAQNPGALEAVTFGINVDSVGYQRGRDAFSLYNCPPELDACLRAALAPYATITEGEPWVQGDHSMFLMHNRPCLALTSEHLSEIMADVIHTPKDRPEILEPERLAVTARAVRDVIRALEAHFAGE